MKIDKGKLFNTWDDFCSMVFSDLIEFVRSLINEEKLSKKELAALLDISTGDVDKILYNELSNITLKTYLHIISLQSFDTRLRSKSKYDAVEKNLHEKKNYVLQVSENLSKKELAGLLGISIIDVDKFLYDHSSGKSKYDKVEKKLHEKKNAFLDALKECKPDSNYLQQLRELAKTNVGNEKLCELIRYYTN